MFVDVFRVQCADFSLFSHWLNLCSVCPLAMAVYLDVEELALENEYLRVCPGPSISVADLEGAIEAYCTVVGYRNVQEVVDAIKECKCTWKTSPKAVACKQKIDWATSKKTLGL